MRSAVLLLVFNRPESTRQVFEAIRAARPPRLYIAADGPRPSREGEHERCNEVRQIATDVDWPCEVKTLFREINLGCKMGVSTGIDWFFSHEEEGIILEDDILPVPSFFPFCDELLDRYRHEDKVGLISGCNLISKHYNCPHSYFFSRYNHIWGWASWRRAWQHYDVEMRAWPEWKASRLLQQMSDGSRAFESSWSSQFDDTHAGKIDTWDYQWTFAFWRHGMLAVLPAHNQIRNLGFGPEATHTTVAYPIYLVESQPKPLTFPLRHPARIERSLAADRLIERRVFGLTPLMGVALAIKKTLLGGALIRIYRALLRRGR